MSVPACEQAVSTGSAASPNDPGDQTGGANMIRILVADEHALYRTGLRTILQAALPEAEFLEAADFDGVDAQPDGRPANPSRAGQLAPDRLPRIRR
jgi:hypothetical protein